jgi:hypothetical protein
LGNLDSILHHKKDEIQAGSCGFERRSGLCTADTPKFEYLRDVRIKDEASNIHRHAQDSREMETRKIPNCDGEPRETTTFPIKMAQKLKKTGSKRQNQAEMKGLNRIKKLKNPVQELAHETGKQMGWREIPARPRLQCVASLIAATESESRAQILVSLPS